MEGEILASRQTVLLVDEDATVRLALQKVLSADGGGTSLFGSSD